MHARCSEVCAEQPVLTSVLSIIGSKGADRMANLVASDQLVVLGAYQCSFGSI